MLYLEKRSSLRLNVMLCSCEMWRHFAGECMLIMRLFSCGFPHCFYFASDCDQSQLTVCLMLLLLWLRLTWTDDWSLNQHVHVYVTCAARIMQIQIESTLVFALLIKPQVSGRSTSITTLLPSHVVTSTVVSGHPRLLLLSVSAVSDVAS